MSCLNMWLRAIETEINAERGPAWLGKYVLRTSLFLQTRGPLAAFPLNLEWLVYCM